MKPLNRSVVFDSVLTQCSHWWELGYRDLPYGYKDLINTLFPYHTFGQVHASFIRSACTAWEEKYGTEIGYLLPRLEPRASKWESTIREDMVDCKDEYKDLSQTFNLSSRS